MEWHGLKIYYAVAGLFAVMSYAFLTKGYHGVGCGFLYTTIYFALCGVEDAINNEINKSEKRTKNKGNGSVTGETSVGWWPNEPEEGADSNS
jgi:hypothetical protein